MTSSMSTAYTCYHKQINIKQIHISDCLNRRRLSQIHRAWKKNALANNEYKAGSQWPPNLYKSNTFLYNFIISCLEVVVNNSGNSLKKVQQDTLLSF